ncbi:ead/Ea22-like family protein [Salmonella enterica subsp. enterica serovar Sandiego]|nr:ead/Ea22-like family protein [Salmonella enterica subsp. enterica serovar Sandiego]
MTIDKQALREAAEKADSGEWSYEEFNRLDLPGSAHIRINGRDAIYCLKKPVGGVEQSRAVTAFIAAFNPKVALALLDEVEAAEHTAAVDHEAACSLVEENEELKRRITEMESKNSNLRTIAHDQNELAIKANLDSINDAVEMDRLHKRIAELEAKLSKPVLLPKTNGYWNEQEKAHEEAITLAKRQVRLAGFSVEDM